MLNKVQLIGNLGKDPDVRTLDGGSKVCQFTLATTEKGYTLQNGTKVPDKTEWHNIVMWKGLADVAEKYLHKGDKIYVEGKIRTRSYEDNNKVRRYVTEIFVDNMEMLVVKQQQPQQPAPQPQPQQQYQHYQQYNQPNQFPPASGADDLPFPPSYR
ncbi:single-stranded DNA-binding protein [Phocaeicola plebeius]|uniref:single-stranded DNA-binding protein n=1 Tax=Phocaeicola plebeius TaxID=310297 RepID=UPI00195E3953|nr:single-stranded DNA-binding protein [Phocaeicola plebeius]MBM6844659.1 single-stranded DNA-binding protein [Phocaeicola plebeius]